MTSSGTNVLQRRRPDVKVVLSTLWIFAMFNYLYADVVTLMNPDVLKQMMNGGVGGLHVTAGFLLAASILMETAMAMVLLSRVLGYRANRLLNMVVGVLHTLAVAASMFVGTPASYSIFFAAVEIPCTLLIVWYAWQWKEEEASASVRVPREAFNG
jgi:hypothetical protein